MCIKNKQYRTSAVKVSRIMERRALKEKRQADQAKLRDKRKARVFKYNAKQLAIKEKAIAKEIKANAHSLQIRLKADEARAVKARAREIERIMVANELSSPVRHSFGAKPIKVSKLEKIFIVAEPLEQVA